MDGIDPQKSKSCCNFFFGMVIGRPKKDTAVEDLSIKLPCKLSCNICNCHKERIDPGNIANATTCPKVRYLVASARIDKQTLVRRSKGSAKRWEEASRSRWVILVPYLLIIAFRRSLCHWAELDRSVDENLFMSLSSTATVLVLSDSDDIAANASTGGCRLLLPVRAWILELLPFLKWVIAAETSTWMFFLDSDLKPKKSCFNRIAVAYLLFSSIISGRSKMASSHGGAFLKSRIFACSSTLCTLSLEIDSL